MSKFLKIIVNTVLVLAILVAGGLLIPPMVGVTTVIVDDIYMDTNLQPGSVAYAVNVEKPLKKGDKVLVAQDTARNVYKITDIQGETYTLKDELSVDGTTEERTLNSTVKKVICTIPFIGYVSMALGTTEGLIIVGLGIIFLVILFILSEVWKKDDAEDEQDEEIEEAEEYEEEESLSRRERKKAAKKAKQAAKETEKEEKKTRKEAKQKKQDKKQAKADRKAAKKAKHATKKVDESDIEQEVQEQEVQEQPEIHSAQEYSQEERELFEETRGSLAAELASMMDDEEVPEDGLEQQIESQMEDSLQEDKKEDNDFSIEQELMQAMEEKNVSEEKEDLASPEENEELQLLEEQLKTEPEEIPEDEVVVSDGEENTSNTEETEELEEELEEEPEEEPEEEQEEDSEEEPENKELAMPAYTKEELEQLIIQEGDSPRVIEDEESGITLFDYSDIL